jgi:hypothetical protein
MRESYSTAREPDNCIYVACGNRKETKCPSCSAVYKADVYHLVLEGMVGGPVVPASVSGHPMVFATFTAPSFGAVHAHIRKGYTIEPCRRRSRLGEKCPHGVRLGCWERHKEDDPRLGTPLCPECFRYEEQVLWNRLAPKLWERTMIYLPRTIARLLGMRMKDLDAVLRKPQFAKVGEYQGRGAIHFHAIVRLDGKGPDGELVAPPAECTVELLTEAITETARSVEVTPAELEGRMTLRWGTEVYVRPIRRGGVEVSQEAVAAYVAKYATKGTEGLVVGGEGRNDHLQRLTETAWELDACPEFARLRLGEAAIDLGFRGHYSTRSRRYSTTLKAKRQVRRDYVRRRRLPKGTTEFLDCWGRPRGRGPGRGRGALVVRGVGLQNQGGGVARPRASLHHLIDPFHRKERLGEMPLGHRLTWRRKPKGTRACRESGDCPKTCRAGSRKTRAIWRRPDCLNPSSRGCKATSSDTTSWSGAAGTGRLIVRRLNSPSGGRWPVRPLKGTDGAPTSRSMRRSGRESEIAYGARALWRRSLRSSPGTGKPSTWRREAGISITQRGRSA